ncbi:hypothetical protein C6B38_02940 [Spiroplasma sp. ChiS]|nr:hypothetical protein C6B38_02940 [Spiroplasma sp. ChiS]
MYRVCVKYRITIRLPKQVPEAVGNSFLALVPIMFIAIIIAFIHFVVGFDMTTFLNDFFSPFGSFLVKNIGGVIIVVFLITFLWRFGIHGGSLVQSVTHPFWIIALDENQNALQNGNLIQNDFVEPFFQWFAQYGGAGSTIRLVIIGSIIAKSKLVKTTTRTSLIPIIFNINEPILFGLPILVNPYMWVPFVFSPVAGAIVGFGAQKAMGINWVASVPWTVPGPIGAYFASGGQWQAIITSLIVLGVSLAIWLPFVLWFDRVTTKRETEITNQKEVKING